MIVFAGRHAGDQLAPRYGSTVDPLGLVAAAIGSIAILVVSRFSPTFLPFLGGMSVFLLAWVS